MKDKLVVLTVSVITIFCNFVDGQAIGISIKPNGGIGLEIGGNRFMNNNHRFGNGFPNNAFGGNRFGQRYPNNRFGSNNFGNGIRNGGFGGPGSGLHGSNFDQNLGNAGLGGNGNVGLGGDHFGSIPENSGRVCLAEGQRCTATSFCCEGYSCRTSEKIPVLHCTKVTR